MQENSHFNSDNAAQVATQGVQKESAKAFNFSLVALVAVAVITAVFFALSTLTQSQISGKNDEISSIKSKISVIEADKKNIVASIIASNKLSPSVNLSKLLSDFRAVASKYQVAFQNFAIKNDEITTNLIAQNDDKDAAQQGNFSLDPIFSLAGNRATRTTTVTFKIVPTQTAQPTSENTSN